MQIYNVEERDNEQALDADRLRRLLGIKLVLQHDRDAVRESTRSSHRASTQVVHDAGSCTVRSLRHIVSHLSLR